jgi:hypothetical protein
MPKVIAQHTKVCRSGVAPAPHVRSESAGGFGPSASPRFPAPVAVSTDRVSDRTTAPANSLQTSVDMNGEENESCSPQASIAAQRTAPAYAQQSTQSRCRRRPAAHACGTCGRCSGANMARAGGRGTRPSGGMIKTSTCYCRASLPSVARSSSASCSSRYGPRLDPLNRPDAHAMGGREFNDTGLASVPAQT